MTSLLISSPPNSISHRFSMQIFKLQRRSCKLSFIFPPRRQSAQDSLLAGQFFRCLYSQVKHYCHDMLRSKLLGFNKDVLEWRKLTLLINNRNLKNSDKFLWCRNCNASRPWYEEFSPFLSFRYLSGKNSTHCQICLLVVAWSHRITWTKTLTCPSQTIHWKEEKMIETEQKQKEDQSEWSRG